MRVLGVVFAFAVSTLFAGLSMAMPPAPWVGGPSGEHSVIGGRSIHRPAVPGKALLGKGTVGVLNVIAVRSQFNDAAFETGHDKAFFESVLAMVSQYYSDVSEGQLTLNFTVSNSVYTLNQSMGYYGDESLGGADALIVDSVQAADADINFSQFDVVMVLHAGMGDESTPGDDPGLIWSQRVGFSAINADGVDISGGVVVPEKQNNPGSSIVGVIAHEFGHELGLPDLYDVDGSSEGIGEWGIMGSGSWLNNAATPSEFTAWSKIFLGWASVTELSSNQTGFQLLPASSGNQVVKINARGNPGSREYFLIEYRRKAQGTWDEFLPGEGLLIWHIDEDVGGLGIITGSGCQKNRWNCNEVNTEEEHKYVDLEEADGQDHLDTNTNRGDAGDPYVAGNTFTPSTNPGSKNYAGQDTGVSVINVSSPGASMAFGLALGFYVKSVSLVDADTMDIEYNRTAGGPTAGNYTLSLIDGTGAVNPNSATLQGDGVTVRLSFASPINANGIYRLTVQNESDSSSTLLQFNPTTIDNPLGTNAAVLLNGHTVWNAAGSPYYITDTLTIENHLSLTITEGAVVKIKKVAAPNQIDIIVSGTLNVQGTPNNPVLITSAEGSSPGDWGTIKFRSEADDQSTISNAVIEYGVRGITLSSASPTISHSTFRNFSDNGIILFGDSAPTISGNTLSNNDRGLSCWENSKPRIVGNLITNNNRGVVCGNSAIPTIIGNSFDGNSEIGLALQEQTAVLNPTIAGNNFINQRSQTGAWGIFVFDSDTSPASISALHNYFGDSARNDTNTVDVQTSSSSGVVDIGQPGSSSRLSNPVDWTFSPTSISFRDSGYVSALSNVPPGSPLYIQMSGTGSDTTNANSTLVQVKSSATDTAGIYVHLDETGADTGIYRTAETPETLASLDVSSDQSIYRLGAAEGETATASFAADTSVATSALVLQCLVGDADNIGGVTVADIISLMRIAIGADPQPQTSQEICRQDINGSGSVDILDAIAATGIVLGL